MEAQKAVRTIRAMGTTKPVVSSLALAALLVIGLTGASQAGSLSGGKPQTGAKSPSTQGAWLLAPRIGKIDSGAYVPKPCTPICL